jgi:type IV/VI secretion system ImpK/VasF family protein
MLTPRWVQDANPLGMLFRAAYGDFLALLSTQPRVGRELPSLELATVAARRMSEALETIRLSLARQAGARTPVGDVDQAEALQFAFAQVVDETLLNAPWQGRSAWSEFLLEWRMFRTRSGGALLIERIDAITRTNDRASSEVAELYLYCLSLGYAGRLRDRPEAIVELARRRAMLFGFLYQGMAGIDDPDFVLGEGRDGNLIHTAPDQRSLAQRMRVYLLAGAALSVPLVVSILIWLQLRPIVSKVIDQIPVMQ